MENMENIENIENMENIENIENIEHFDRGNSKWIEVAMSVQPERYIHQRPYKYNAQRDPNLVFVHFGRGSMLTSRVVLSFTYLGTWST